MKNIHCFELLFYRSLAALSWLTYWIDLNKGEWQAQAQNVSYQFILISTVHYTLTITPIDNTLLILSTPFLSYCHISL